MPAGSRCSTRSTASSRRSNISATRSTPRIRPSSTQAVETLIENKPKIKSFAPDTGQDLLISGEVDVCLEYNGDILQVMEEDDDLAYVVPEEGSQLWVDNMCIPKGGPNPENAHSFINFILDAEVHGAIATYVRYPCPNAAALDFIPEEDRNNPALYPAREVLERCEVAGLQGRGDREPVLRGADPRARRLSPWPAREKMILSRALLTASMVP